MNTENYWEDFNDGFHNRPAFAEFMRGKPLVVTHCGQLGDFIYVLAICSWLWKVHQRKTFFVLPHAFGPFRFIENLLWRQPFTAGVCLCDHPVQTYAHGGQPYRFDPFLTLAMTEAGNKFPFRLGKLLACQGSEHTPPYVVGWQGNYVNFGFRGYPNKFITEFCAEEWGMDWDRGFVLELGRTERSAPPLPSPLPHSTNGGEGDAQEKTGTAREDTRPTMQQEPIVFTEHANFDHVPGFVRTEEDPFKVRIDTRLDILTNARRMALAKEAHCYFSGMAVILYHARVPFILHAAPGHRHPGNVERYFPDRSRYELRECPF